MEKKPTTTFKSNSEYLVYAYGLQISHSTINIKEHYNDIIYFISNSTLNHNKKETPYLKETYLG